MLSRRTIIRAFKWPIPSNAALRVLRAAYMAEVMARGFDFVDDEATGKNIQTVANALTARDNKRGIMLCGKCGNGKTTMLRAIKTATNFLAEQNIFGETVNGSWYPADVNIRIAHAKEIAIHFADEQKAATYAKTNLLGIEDMGTEPAEVQVYGNIVNPIATLLESRYASGLTTFITTNLTPRLIGEKYQERIADRLNETMAVIPFDNASYRTA